MADSDAPPPPLTAARLRGRRVAQVLYYGLAAIFAVTATLQLTRQIFFGSPPQTQTFSNCHDGLRGLLAAIESGREKAEALPDDPAKTGFADEEAPLRRFRETLAPSWEQRDHVAELCAANPADRALLDAIERLRYSEEHGVRHEAAELTALRQRVRRMAKQRLSPTPQSSK